MERYSFEVESCGEDYLYDMHTQFLNSYDKERFIQFVVDAKSSNHEHQRKTIGLLRQIFAQISIGLLDPDLVIMDEFQRFSSILDNNSDNEQAMLTQQFFTHNHTNTKILLLSATPYKPYSTLEELNVTGCDEHLDDFKRVVNFLFTTEDNIRRFKLVWHEFNNALVLENKFEELLEKKSQAEDVLYGVMCRTERFNSGIIRERKEELQVSIDDILSFAQGQDLLDTIQAKSPNGSFRNLPLEYVKSAPYLCSFMDRYELKRYIAKNDKKFDNIRKTLPKYLTHQ